MYEDWCENHCISALQWSLQGSEKVLAAYYSLKKIPLRSDGIVALWDVTTMKSDRIFRCQSAVTTSSLSHFDLNFIFGGTTSGQLVLWDKREAHQTPVQEITALNFVSAIDVQGANNLLTISSDGRMCSFEVRKFVQPLNVIELLDDKGKGCSLNCMAVRRYDGDTVFMGCEDGFVRVATSDRGLITLGRHQAPVTGISSRKVLDTGSDEFADIFLTSSIDSSIKLWSKSEGRVLHSYEDTTEVMDVQFSPVHPSLFASVDLHGRMNLWNLSRDLEIPLASLKVDDTDLHRVAWAPTGQRIAIGTECGKIRIFTIGVDLAGPEVNECDKLRAAIASFMDRA
ncbi:MAG: hypothetical protein ACRDAX_00100 [Propionibacteriaceae bacterium]